MREKHISQTTLMLLLVLVVAGCTRVQVPRESGSPRETQATTLDKSSAQLGQPPKIHLVRSRFEPGPTSGDLTLVFDVNPIPQSLPRVSWLGATPRDDARALAVDSGPVGRYSAVLANVPPVGDGRVLIELSDPSTGTYDLHSAEFALRQHVADGPSSRPSRDGRFVVFTKPEGVSPKLRLLIGSGEQPLEDLPAGVTNRAVAAVYSLDFLPKSDQVVGWQLTMATGETDANPALFYLAKGSKVWKLLESHEIEEHGLRAARVEGAGIYLIVRR